MLAGLLGGIALAGPIAAKDSLGVYEGWAAFRDDAPLRCYAIAKPQRDRDSSPYATVSTWPSRGKRGQVHVRLSDAVSKGAPVRLTIGAERFALAANARNAWGKDPQMDAAIVAAMRSATTMTVSARGRSGRRFTDRYDLAGAATAIDAATVGCIARR